MKSSSHSLLLLTSDTSRNSEILQPAIPAAMCQQTCYRKLIKTLSTTIPIQSHPSRHRCPMITSRAITPSSDSLFLSTPTPSGLPIITHSKMNHIFWITRNLRLTGTTNENPLSKLSATTKTRRRTARWQWTWTNPSSPFLIWQKSSNLYFIIQFIS